MSGKQNWFSILVLAFLIMTVAQSARAEDYLIEVIERPANNQFDTTSRVGRYKFRIKIHPNSSLEQIDGFGKICVADTAVFRWALGSSPQVPPLQSRTDSKTVEGSVKAVGDWTGQKNVYFSVAMPGSECASNGLNPAGQSNRAQENARLTPVLNIPSGPINAGDLPTGPIASLPPYRLRIQPSMGANSETAITLKAEPTGTGVANCKFEAVPTSGGTAWSAVRNNCSEVSPTLAAGTYTLRLTMRRGRAGGGYDDLTEEKRDYVVIPPPNYTIPLATPVLATPVLATELFNSTMYREHGEALAPCEFWYGLLADPINESFGIICDKVYKFGKKNDREVNYNRKLQNGWRIKRIEVEKSEYLGGYAWVVKPTEGSDNPHMRIRYWVDAHLGTLTDSNTKFIKVTVKIWIEGPSHLSPYEANKPR